MVCTSHLCGQTLVLNEVQNSNTYTVADEDDDFEDWVELLNIGLEAIQLEGYGLSDNSSNAYK